MCSLPTSAWEAVGAKYGLTDLLRIGSLRLQEVLPSTLHQLQNSYQLSNGFHERRIMPMLAGTPPKIDMNTTDAITAINLARIYNIPCILPAAFCVCSRLPPKTLVECVADAHGNLSLLSPADLVRCFNGQHVLDREYALAIQDLRLVIAGYSCEDSDECSEAQRTHHETAICLAMGCCFAGAESLDADLDGELCDTRSEARRES
ncbi:hypothetical protein QCA50_005609 [Cerrena zonata]|uniref:Uncharacterized protein n=1 Tax=Cerrena zonata TaxID=2478898 RepID=A0AAW0GLQ2_9APHY